jgi:hypothetical protein
MKDEIASLCSKQLANETYPEAVELNQHFDILFL